MDKLINFSELSISLTKKIDKDDKKKEGIFFSPKTQVSRIIKYVKEKKSDIKTILEPSCGSCEFIDELNKEFSGVEITGVERNQIIFDEIKSLKWSRNNVSIINSCYFTYYDKNKLFDLIIGNPPYFVLKKNNIKSLIDKEYFYYLDGRPNIYVLFILLGLKQLKKDGIMAFILPCNFLNCQYYNKIRELIFKEYKILDIWIDKDSSFIETEQSTISLIIQKSSPSNNSIFSHNINGNIILNTPENIIKINELLSNSTTLSKMNINVTVGNLVWNENKDILTDDSSQTRLIYSGDLKNNELTLTKYRDDLKKNYIKKSGIKRVVLLLNRGYGKGKYSFQYAIVNLGDKPFLVENHLICIDIDDELKKTKDEKIEIYNKIIQSFKNKKTNEFIELYFENNAINTNELQNIFPIFLT